MLYLIKRQLGAAMLLLGLTLSVSAEIQTDIPILMDTPVVQAKLPSIAGSTEGDLWLLDARGERLINAGSPGQSIDLHRPGSTEYAYVSDLVIQNGWVYLSATFEDALYKTSIAALRRLQNKVNPAIELTRVTSADPLRDEMRQHFLRSGLWLAGQSRTALLERAQRLSRQGWPVSDGQRMRANVRFDLEASIQGQLCVDYKASTNKTGVSQLCHPLPTGWKVAAIYPVGMRPMARPYSCSSRPLSAAAKWLWLEVDLIGESANSIESHTLLMRAAVDKGRLACWDSEGYRVDAETAASLMRVFTLVGPKPEMATTLVPLAQVQWSPKSLVMSADFWPEPLPTLTWSAEPSATRTEVLERAWPYALQSWTLPQDPAARSRYTQWQKEGFFARCFPEVESCGKPLGPRYLAQARVQKTYVGLPYGWGGNDTPELYLTRIAEGAYPGDIHTNNVISKAVAGVDCSGFITNVWQLPQRVVTTCHGGPDAWTPQQGDTSCVGSFSSRINWQSGQSGDALLTPGHVRLVAQVVESQLAEAGRGLFVEIVESSGFCAGACHRLLPAREAGRYRMMRPHPPTSTPKEPS